ncbi:glycosyl hydrolase family 2 [Cellulophaga sp. RHA19]|uniref:glycoside hydrolase family 2 TIM barrel-domain containing protein n=1 Tax=Cellulophaga sp. RHA19 TaxID=1798237 RepID=UPI000C2C2133|nr:glycoside hydrolase family 2 TIM barrel-domain containing protein [Cellulophaga sp. RHA19]PKB43572.1 glycosyl hydrolase family 2 [Cellulophaga sp. RHA19]
MKYKIAIITLFLITAISCSTQETVVPKNDFNFDWNFKLEDSVSGIKDNDWQKIRLPHDWSISNKFDSIKGEGATGYLLGGIGYYEKKFTANLNNNQVAYIVFDGVYNNATITLNNTKLGFHPYGYSPFYYDITDALKENGKENTINVKVDRTRYADSRWYTGSGIYRNVKFITKNKLHIPIWGSFITTPSITSELATVNIQTTINNKYNTTKTAELTTTIYDKNDIVVNTDTKKISVAKNALLKDITAITVDNPKLWDTNNPTLYTAITIIKLDDDVIDTQKTKFGIRSIKFDADTGFYLNGKNRKIKGVCLHHDAGLVGAAVPKGVWKRRLQALKDIGCNAIRISHNPASNEFLDLCDEMGFLVQDEFFDEWDNPKDKRKNMNEKSVDYITRGYVEHFQEWAEKDLKNTVLSHRNHPSIFQWSIGNEIEWTYPRNAESTGFFNNMDWSGNYFWSLPPNDINTIKEKLNTLPKAKYDIGETAKKLAKWTKELDTTRYVIANSILPSSSYESGYADALDIIGFSYRRVIYDYGHKNYPNLPVMGTENLGQWHEWKAVMERPFISGTFLWTGIDYMGESNKGWPKKGTSSGLLDLAGFKKPSYHMFNTLWNNKPNIYITSQILDKSIYKLDANSNPVEKKEGKWKTALWQWHNVNEHWNYKENETTVIEVYSNCEEVELYLNDKSLGIKKLSDFEDHIYKWAVPFKKGTLKAVGLKADKKVETKIITTSEPTTIKLTADKEILTADGYSVAHIVAQIEDKDGNPIKSEDKTIDFKIIGDAKLLGVDNGSITNTQYFKNNKIKTYRGKALLIIQSLKDKTNPITIKVNSDTINSNEIKITIEPNNN